MIQPGIILLTGNRSNVSLLLSVNIEAECALPTPTFPTAPSI